MEIVPCELFSLMCACCAADNMSAMVVLLKSFAPGDMVAAQQASAATTGAGGGSTASAADGSVGKPASDAAEVADPGQQAASVGEDPATARHHLRPA